MLLRHQLSRSFRTVFGETFASDFDSLSSSVGASSAWDQWPDFESIGICSHSNESYHPTGYHGLCISYCMGIWEGNLLKRIVVSFHKADRGFDCMHGNDHASEFH